MQWMYCIVFLDLRFSVKALKTLENQYFDKFKTPGVQAVYSFLLKIRGQAEKCRWID